MFLRSLTSTLLLCGFASAVLAQSNAYPIFEIQGDGSASPLEGETVVTEGVITGWFPDLSGYFIQDTIGDQDTLTSDGIFVYQPSAPTMQVGDYVEVEGEVQEYYGWTELGNVSSVNVLISGVSIAPTPVSMPRAEGLGLEYFEGMYIEFATPMYVTDNYNLHRYGEVGMAPDGRLQIPTNHVDVSDIDPEGTNSTGLVNIQAVFAEVFANERNTVVLDDGQNGSWQQPIVHLDTLNTLRCGSYVSALRGCLGYSFSKWRLQPTEPVVFEGNDRPQVPEFPNANVTVAGFNVLNFFTTIDDGSNEARGADSQDEYNRQRAKIVAAITEMDADVTALMEIENNGETAIDSLVAALNEATAPGTYGKISGSFKGTDMIQCAMVYKTASVAPIDTPWATTDTIFLPPSIAQGFTHTASGEKFIVIGNHFQYKGGCDDATGLDQDQEDGQACWNERRRLQAAALIDWIPEVQARYGDMDVVAVGDFNAYGQEDPIDILVASELTKLETDWYTYVFQGEFGSLDHAFATPSVINQLEGAAVWHINSDEPRFVDYNTEDVGNIGDFYEPNAYRASDHDPVIVALSLDSTASNTGLADVANGATLLRAFPNPANVSMRLLFTPTEAASYQVVITDVSGRLVAMPANTTFHAGSYAFVWDCSQQEAGVYLATVLKNGRALQTVRVVKQ